MKQRLLLILFIVVPLWVSAQAPEGISYQAAARDSDGQPIRNQTISIRISILDEGPSGRTVYQESHTVTTNGLGLFTLAIGQGDPTVSSFNEIPWNSGTKWVEVAMDVNGGNNFQIMGSQQLMSVAYALYAKEAGVSFDTGDGVTLKDGVLRNTKPDVPVSITGEGAIQVSGAYPNYLISADVTGGADADADSTNELQTIAKEPATREVTLSNGGGTFVDEVDDADSNPANEIQTLSKDDVTREVSLSNGGGIFVDEINDADSNPTNEIQTLSKNATTREVTLSEGGGSFVDQINDADSNPVNEIQNLSEVVSQGNDAGGAQLKNVADPTQAQDATTKGYVDAADDALRNALNTTYAFSVNYSYTNITGSEQNTIQMPFVGTDFDDFNSISSNTYVVQQDGTYIFYVTGSTGAANELNLRVNGSDRIVPRFDQGIGLAYYNGTFLLQLQENDIVELNVGSILNLTEISGTFFGYKL